MACQTSRANLRSVFFTPSANITVSACLVPAFSLSLSKRSFSSCSPRRSRIGSAPITIPEGVTFALLDLPRPKKQGRNSDKLPKVAAETRGPLGQKTLSLPPFVTVDHNEVRRQIRLSVEDQNIKHQKAMWGTIRALLHNNILGVSEGHTAILRLVGVGYRATIEQSAVTKPPEYPGQQFVSLKVGYSHPIELGVPPGVNASTPQPTRILLEGNDKQVLMQFAAEIRAWRKPEPYKGKGIFVNDETIRLKAKKIK